MRFKATTTVSGTRDVDRMLTDAWSALLWLARDLPGRRPPQGGAFGLSTTGELRRLPPDDGAALLLWDPSGGWRPAPALPAAAHDLFELYLPVIAPPSGQRPRTFAHLGQSLDGHIATDSGDSCYVTGPENILHLHRMRALCDAVVVGAGTVAADDPRLTTRKVTGDNPLRVVLDPHRRLAADYRVFSDGQAETLLVCSEDEAGRVPSKVGQGEILAVSWADGRLDLPELLSRLRLRRVRSIFIEGGGATVSCFLESNLLDRLQIAVAPLVIGSGRPSLRLPSVSQLGECLRPRHRIFRMGGDILFDCELQPPNGTPPAPPPGGLKRIL